MLVYGIRPRAAIVNNGTRKGAVPESMKTLFSSPGIEDVWQIHFSQLSGQEYTVPGMFIANGLDEPLSAMPIQPIAAPAPGPNTPNTAPTTRHVTTIVTPNQINKRRLSRNRCGTPQYVASPNGIRPGGP